MPPRECHYGRGARRFNGVILALVALTLPPPLSPGDRIAIVAPASPFPRGELWRGLAWLRTRYALRISPRLFARDAYLAGDDDARAGELAGALADDGVKAVLAARGGYGAMRILERVPWRELARRPRWIVGFSDVTALHAAAWAEGIASVHGPNVTGLGRDASPAMRAAWLRCLERPGAAHAWTGLGVVHPGRGGGPLVGGNLSLVHAMAAAGRLVVPQGAVLALEDVTEAPYRVDRMLTSLRLAGMLARASAIVFGGFDRCAPGPDGRAVDEVLAERTRDLGIPVLRGAPFGHGANNEAFVLGRDARVAGDSVFFD
jgi:muramoyltetrapeptide carboxypeptidase